MNLDRRRMLLTVVAATATAALDGATTLAQETGQKIDREAAGKALGDALNSLVQFEVVRRGGRLLDEGERAVDSFVQGGVKRLVERGEVTNGYSVSIAIDGARRFGNELVNETLRMERSIREIGKTVVTSVTARICPMYPFC